ncbi:Phenylacetate-coenzyme A ligase [Legionella lansingensis]|uniref:Phenylacetate-coenzyme A ligase n=1 Tax=Legionella lansingensis TaxID=45067 RepID=A0A0W0VMQ6_9GAMM|nr:phenylacetate--CoA ligase family protein [Legionella lansingensis]KTD21415.1 Phenylacetate-coenzyme A ligase [Legionella lansingensis]SNV51950.1 Phenylacetate-coenzyme A ligase [Legionella lansingensis]
MSSLFLSEDDQKILCDRFNELVKHVKENFAFYKRFYGDIEQTEIHSLSDLARFPLIDKHVPGISTLADEVLAKNPPAYFETSGTSGNPFPVIPDLGPERGGEFANFIFDWLGLDKTEVKRAIIALPFEMNPIGIKYFAALTKAGITAIPVGVKTLLCPPKKVLELFDRLKPELLIGRPLETLRYAQAMKAQGKDPSKSSIKKIILTGEIISKSKCKRISHLYGGASVHGVYGLTELDSGGLVACSKHQYHLPSKPYLVVELLKDDFKTPVQNEGEIGNIVLTNTHRNYMPLLRYKTGDFGTLHFNCGCEYDTPVINVLGRSADLIRCKKSGKSVFPIQIEEILFQYDEIGCEYQIISRNGAVELRIELTEMLDQDKTTTLVERLKADITRQLSIEIAAIQVFNPDQLASKLGIAKAKAGTLYVLDGLSDEEIAERLQINF